MKISAAFWVFLGNMLVVTACVILTVFGAAVETITFILTATGEICVITGLIKEWKNEA
ncbi:MAG: hypothetical protein Q4C48_03340 [Lachnospiraceae bacterium]|nr:hypothetical protein [Lachnospiraceae bacterium]